MRIAALTIAALLTSAPMAAAQGSMRVDRSLPSNEAPTILKNVDIEGHLNAQLPLDLAFRDETGRTVKVRDLLREGRPVILAPVYYECPMLCTQVLNSLFTALGVISLDPGKDFDGRRDELRSEGAARPGARQEGRLHGEVQAAGHRVGVPLPDRRPGRRLRRCSTRVGFKYQYDPAIDQYAHPAMIAVLTPDGRISKYFLGIDYSARDLRFALIEASEGHVGSTFERKVITWCYNYDPTTGTYGLLTMRLVQAGGIVFIVGMLAFWTVMWRRERATAAA